MVHGKQLFPCSAGANLSTLSLMLCANTRHLPLLRTRSVGFPPSCLYLAVSQGSIVSDPGYYGILCQFAYFDSSTICYTVASTTVHSRSGAVRRVSLERVVNRPFVPLLAKTVAFVPEIKLLSRRQLLWRKMQRVRPHSRTSCERSFSGWIRRSVGRRRPRNFSKRE